MEDLLGVIEQIVKSGAEVPRSPCAKSPVSEKTSCRRLDTRRLQGKEASGCIPLPLATRKAYQAALRQSCKGRLQSPPLAGEERNTMGLNTPPYPGAGPLVSSATGKLRLLRADASVPATQSRPRR